MASSGERKPDRVVLLVEDEPQVRELLTLVLAHQGYELYEAESPVQAQRLASQMGGRLTLLVTDVVLPGMSGPALAESLRQQIPGLPVVYLSGYTTEFLPHLDWTREYFLPKPFALGALIAMVARAIREKGLRP